MLVASIPAALVQQRPQDRTIRPQVLDRCEGAATTHKWTFSPPFPLPNFGRSFIVANDQLATLDTH